MTHFFNHLTKTSSFRCRSNVQEIILPKNMFGCSLKLILGFFKIFYIFSYKPKYSYTIMYECENSPLSHELSLLPKWGVIYELKSLWDFKSEITSLHFTDFTLMKVIPL